MPARRIVTANNSDGESYLLHDGPTPGTIDLGAFLDEEIWIDDPAEFDPDNVIDPAAADSFNLIPPSGGSRVRVFTFKPNDGYLIFFLKKPRKPIQFKRFLSL